MTDQPIRHPSAEEYQRIAERFQELAVTTTGPDKENYLRLAAINQMLARRRVSKDQEQSGRLFASPFAK